MMTPDERNANKVIPLVGVCDRRKCTEEAIVKLGLVTKISKDEPVVVIDGTHKGLIGFLYSTNTLGVSFIRPEPQDGTLKAVKTRDVARR
jgi:hypothetical protein